MIFAINTKEYAPSIVEYCGKISLISSGILVFFRCSAVCVSLSSTARALASLLESLAIIGCTAQGGEGWSVVFVGHATGNEAAAATATQMGLTSPRQFRASQPALSIPKHCLLESDEYEGLDLVSSKADVLLFRTIANGHR